MAHIEIDNAYVIEGADVAALLRLAYRLCEGTRMNADDRRDVGQQIQAIVAKVTLFNP